MKAELIYLAYPFALAFIICLIIGPLVIRIIQRLKFGQQVRDDGPASHLKKQNVPTMGGVMMIIAIGICALVFRFRGSALIAVLATLGYALIGFLDDFIKIVKKRSLGLKAYQKIVGQFGIAIIMAVYAYKNPNIGSSIYVPFLGFRDMGIWFVPFAVFVIIAITNGVNLADGLDGLAARMTMIQEATLGVIIGVSALSFTSGTGDAKQLAMMAMAVSGACLGFLRFNSYPARVFMGDTGALGLGGALAVGAIFSKMALLLPIMCVMLVATCVSVILQVGSYKLRHGKRIFKMAPLHHHFELLGYHETTVTAMYTIITIAACVLTMMIAFDIPKF